MSCCHELDTPHVATPHVATNSTPHERFFSFQRRSCYGKSLPTWLTAQEKAFVKRFVRNSENDPYVDEVELINVIPTFADIRVGEKRRFQFVILPRVHK